MVPIQNIPVFVLMFSVVAFSVWLLLTDSRYEKHDRGIDRVRRCESRRRAMHLVNQGRKARARRYHTN